MHILFICDPIDKQKAGIFQYTLQVAYHIWKLNTQHQLSFITLKSDKIMNEIIATPLPNTLPFLVNDPVRQFITLPRLINKLKPDIVVEPAHFGPFNLSKGIKRITVIHDLTPLLFPSFHLLSSHILHRIFLGRILRKADLILTNSENTRHDIYQYSSFAKVKTNTLLLGKDDFFKPTNEQSILEKYKIRKPYILSVGTLEPRKNLITLLNAFEKYKKTCTNETVLVLIGQNGWKNKQLEETLVQHPFKNEIVRTGYIERLDLPALYSHCLTFIYPSLYEGFGLPLLEAMACGAPAIAADNSSLKEVGGEAAIYFPTKDDDILSSRIQQVSENITLQEELRKKSLIQAQKFSWKKYAESFLELIEKKWGTIT